MKTLRAELATAAAITAAGAAVFIWGPRAFIPAFPCPFHAITGLPCLTCGGTRAISHLVDGEFGAALEMNPLVFFGVLACAAFVIYAVTFWILRRAPVRLDFRRGPALFFLRFGTLFAVAANWIYLVADGR